MGLCRLLSEMTEPRLDSAASGMVLVPVPQKHLAAVYELLAELMHSEAGRPATLGEDVEETACVHCGATAYLAVGGAYHCSECGLAFRRPGRPGTIEVDHENGCWSRAMVDRLYAEVGSSISGKAVSVVAERAPATVTSDEITNSLRIDSATLRAELGALSKACRRLFGRKIWPMSARQGWGEGARMGYRMPEGVAEWWQEASGAAGVARRDLARIRAEAG